MIVSVELAERSYDVVLGEDARRELAALIVSRAPKAKVAAIVTSKVLSEQSWFDLQCGITQHVLIVPEGESAKTIASFSSLCEQLAELQLSRDDVIVGVGGGAVTDLAGFAAATYLRGLSLVQVPTSLVGQVDAAIGGKTGVNLRAGKNLVGSFYQPIGVLCDFSTLLTMPERERLAGLGEVAKCWLLEGGFAAELPAVSFHDLIVMSVSLKAAIVSEDERKVGDGHCSTTATHSRTRSRRWRSLVTLMNYDTARRSPLASPLRLASLWRSDGSTRARSFVMTMC